MPKSNYVLAEDPATDLQIAEAMVAELEEYLIKDELYRTVIVRTPSGDQSLRLTGGDLLSRFQRLTHEKESLSAAEQQRLAAAIDQAEQVLRAYKTRFNQRLMREMKSRLDSLRWFLDDCRGDVQRCRSEFPFEMRNRQRIEEIVKRVGGDLPEDQKARLAQIDRRIRENTHGTAFIWDERLKNAFPPQPYWYLYVSP